MLPARQWKNRIIGHGEEAADQLLANPKNWRIHPKAQQDALKGVLSKIGWVQDVIVNKRTGFVVDGHARVALAISVGERVPVVYVDLDEQEEAAILATLDPLAAMAGKDEEIWAELTAGMDEAYRGLVEATEVKDFTGNPGLTDPDEAPEPPDDPVTVSGDLWLLGEHRVLCGDSTSVEDVERLLDGKKADLVFTDPPYGIGKAIANDNLSEKELLTFNRDWASLLPLFISDDAHVVCFHSPRLFWTALDAIREAGLNFERYLTFYKPNDCTYPWQGWLLKSEAILLFTKGNPDFIKVEPYQHDTVQHMHGHEQKQDRGGHPCSKPGSFVVEFMKRFSGDIVLDLFGGAGSTLIGAEANKRTGFLIEIAPQYVDVTVKRWQAFTGKEATLDGDGRTFAELEAVRRGNRADREVVEVGAPGPSRASVGAGGLGERTAAD